jgi:hypothetical protein
MWWEMWRLDDRSGYHRDDAWGGLVLRSPHGDIDKVESYHIWCNGQFIGSWTHSACLQKTTAMTPGRQSVTENNRKAPCHLVDPEERARVLPRVYSLLIQLAHEKAAIPDEAHNQTGTTACHISAVETES